MLLITAVLLLATIFDDASAYRRRRRKCFVPRRGPRRGQCIDTRPYDRWGRGTCAQTPGVHACQWLGSRCRCAIREVFMSPPDENPTLTIQENENSDEEHIHLP